jgi:hypothetical protein
MKKKLPKERKLQKKPLLLTKELKKVKHPQREKVKQ